MLTKTTAISKQSIYYLGVAWLGTASLHNSFWKKKKKTNVRIWGGGGKGEL